MVDRYLAPIHPWNRVEASFVVPLFGARHWQFPLNRRSPMIIDNEWRKPQSRFAMWTL